MPESLRRGPVAEVVTYHRHDEGIVTALVERELSLGKLTRHGQGQVDAVGTEIVLYLVSLCTGNDVLPALFAYELILHVELIFVLWVSEMPGTKGCEDDEERGSDDKKWTSSFKYSFQAPANQSQHHDRHRDGEQPPGIDEFEGDAVIVDAEHESLQRIFEGCKPVKKYLEDRQPECDPPRMAPVMDDAQCDIEPCQGTKEPIQKKYVDSLIDIANDRARAGTIGAHDSEE